MPCVPFPLPPWSCAPALAWGRASALVAGLRDFLLLVSFSYAALLASRRSCSRSPIAVLDAPLLLPRADSPRVQQNGGCYAKVAVDPRVKHGSSFRSSGMHSLPLPRDVRAAQIGFSRCDILLSLAAPRARPPGTRSCRERRPGCAFAESDRLSRNRPGVVAAGRHTAFAAAAASPLCCLFSLVFLLLSVSSTPSTSLRERERALRERERLVLTLHPLHSPSPPHTQTTNLHVNKRCGVKLKVQGQGSGGSP